MPHLRVITAVLLGIIGCTAFAASSPLAPIVTFRVPGLDNNIEKIELGNANHDAHSEVLAYDGYNLVLYAISDDSILFRDTLSHTLGDFEMLLADVNQDDAADILIAPYSNEIYLPGQILWYDSARTYRQDRLAVPGQPDLKAICTHSMPLTLESADLDNDGYDELLYSYEALESGVGISECRTIGEAYLFLSFPDSIEQTLDTFLGGLYEIPEISGLGRYLSHSLYERYYEFPGIRSDTYSKSLGSLESGYLWEHKWSWPIPVCVGSYYESRSSSFSFGCLVDATSQRMVVGKYAFRVTCGFPAAPESDTLGFGIAAVSLPANGPSELLWQQAIGSNWTDFISHSSFPDQFFAFAGDTLVRFDATDGALLRKYDPLLPGMKLWGYPLGGDEPYLVLVNHDTVSYYGFDEPTAVDDDGPITLPQTFTLDKPYPNPFNPTVKVPVRLTKTGRLTVEVFNALGQRVHILHDGRMRPGEYELEWDAADFATGVYFFHATFGEETKIEKAVLIK